MTPKTDPIAFYKTAGALFTLIGISAIVQDILPGALTGTRRGRTKWVSIDLALTLAALLILVAGTILTQTVVTRNKQQGHEHGAVVILLSVAGGCVIAKLVLRRALAIGWKSKAGATVPDIRALIKLGVALVAGLGVGAAAVGAVIGRTETWVIGSLTIGGSLTILAGAVLAWLLWRDQSSLDRVRKRLRKRLRKSPLEVKAPRSLSKGGATLDVEGDNGRVRITFFDSAGAARAYMQQHHFDQGLQTCTFVRPPGGDVYMIGSHRQCTPEERAVVNRITGVVAASERQTPEAGPWPFGKHHVPPDAAMVAEHLRERDLAPQQQVNGETAVIDVAQGDGELVISFFDSVEDAVAFRTGKPCADAGDDRGFVLAVDDHVYRLEAAGDATSAQRQLFEQIVAAGEPHTRLK